MTKRQLKKRGERLIRLAYQLEAMSHQAVTDGFKGFPQAAQNLAAAGNAYFDKAIALHTRARAAIAKTKENQP